MKRTNIKYNNTNKIEKKNQLKFSKQKVIQQIVKKTEMKEIK